MKRAPVILPLMLGTFMAALDNSIVNVSLPVMQQQFRVRIDDIQWVITAYMLAFCVFMPLTNWLKSRIGLFNLYVISISVFLAGSILSGFAPSLTFLIAARIVQALGGGALTPVALAMLSSVYGPEQRGRIMGWWGMGVVVGPALGPTLGGVITQYLGWPYIFFVNVPFGLIALVLSFAHLKEIGRRSGLPGRFDLLGYSYFTIAVIALQYGIARIEKTGLHSPQTYGTFAVAIAFLALFVRKETQVRGPVLDLSLFKYPVFVAGILVTAIRSVALFGGLFLLPFLLQNLMGYSELQTGLLLLPASVVLAGLMPLAGSWSDRHGPRNITIAGLVLIALASAMLAFLDRGSGVFLVIAAMVLRGAGLGFLFSPVSAAVLNGVQPRQVTTASSYYSLFMQLGGSIGISILAAVHQHIVGAQPGRPDLLHRALETGFLLSAGLILLAIWPAGSLALSNRT